MRCTPLLAPVPLWAVPCWVLLRSGRHRPLPVTLAGPPVVLFGEGAAWGEPGRQPASPVRSGRDRAEGAGALQPYLVQVHRPGEQAP
ncbi:hypothetical protein [Streptomyces sp. NPDC093094]|uniref:hypothetical protein n=1 Tax=Streptomyces sp. NPDC093094 TaxID=3366026 RepID=UPI00380CE37C